MFHFRLRLLFFLPFCWRMLKFVGVFICCWMVGYAQVLSYCSLHHFDSKWDDAVQECKSRRKNLLCYKSKEEVQKIIDFFFPEGKNLEFWLSRKDCDDMQELSECLLLSIEWTNSRVQHHFQQKCDAYSFICCRIQYEPKSSTTTADTTIVNGGSSVSTISQENTQPSWSMFSVTSTIDDGTITASHFSEYTFSDTSTFTSSSESYSSTTTHFCPSVFKRGILWPQTSAGNIVLLPCPGNSTGTASWFCSELEGIWSPHNPNMSLCHSTELHNIKENFKRRTADETITALYNLFDKDENSIHANDLKETISLVSLLPEKLLQESESLNDTARWVLAEESIAKATMLFSQMIDLDMWTDIPLDEVPKVGSQMLSSADKFGFLLADFLTNKSHHSIINDNIAMEILKQNSTQPISLPVGTGEHSRRGQILLDLSRNPQFYPEKGQLSFIYIYYSNMNNILLDQSIGSLNSPVVSTSVSQAGFKPISVSTYVHVLVEHVHPDQNNTACVFWNLKKHMWDPSGCRLKSSNSSHTLCECDHLTNFAVLMDYQGILTNVDGEIFYYITVVGCSISLVSLALCIAVFTCFKWQRYNAWGVRYSIHRNLCITLFLANFLLVIGLNETKNKMVCAVIAGFLHYFFLSSFSWMLMEGIHIYFLLIVVFASKKTHWKKYYIFGYGFPLLVVGITAAVRPDNYGTVDACWLSIDNGTVWSFTGPVGVILLLNSAALFLAQLKASRISLKDDNIALVRRWLRVTFILFPILGLTWVLGFLYVGKNFKVAAYFFAILNSLQGFCIFICHCLMDKRSRNMIIDSIKKKMTSVATESSSISSKRSKKESKNELIQSNSSTSTSPKSEKRQWWKPWAFNFTANITEGANAAINSSDEPRIVRWSILQEDNVL